MRSIIKKGTILGTIVGAALLTAAPFSLQWSQKTVALSLDSADARIGRPLTPVSVAGVHRRAYRRAVYGTAAAASGRITGPPAIPRLQLRRLRLSSLCYGLPSAMLWSTLPMHRSYPPYTIGLTLPIYRSTLPTMAMGLTPPAIQAMAIGQFTSHRGAGLWGGTGPPAGWRFIAPAGTEARATRIKRP